MTNPQPFAEYDAGRFCPLCTVSLDLHAGPNTCDIAAQKEFILGLSMLGVLR